MIAKKEEKSDRLRAKSTEWEWAVEHLCERYGEDKISVRHTDEVHGTAVGIRYGSKLTKRGAMTLPILLEAYGIYRACIDGILMMTAGYNLNALDDRKQALVDLCDQADAYAKTKGHTIPVGKNGHG